MASTPPVHIIIQEMQDKLMAAPRAAVLRPPACLPHRPRWVLSEMHAIFNHVAKQEGVCTDISTWSVKDQQRCGEYTQVRWSSQVYHACLYSHPDLHGAFRLSRYAYRFSAPMGWWQLALGFALFNSCVLYFIDMLLKMLNCTLTALTPCCYLLISEIPIPTLAWVTIPLTSMWV